MQNMYIYNWKWHSQQFFVIKIKKQIKKKTIEENGEEKVKQKISEEKKKPTRHFHE